MTTDTRIEIPGYRIEKEIGSGAMAAVYLAIQKSLERPVALKIMASSLVADASFCERFLKEGRIIGQLIHPNIVTVYDIGVCQSQYYMAMEYVPGNTLKQRIQQGLAVDEAVEILCQIARALGYAHSRGFLHRDVKPANILFREDNAAILSDFGIAKALGDGTQMTAAGWTVGTPNYMSPEQALGKPVDARCDLYSLGIVFYEMLTGAKPFQASDSFATALMHVNSPVPRLPDQFAEYQGILDRLLAKHPDERYASAEELIKAIGELRARRPAVSAAQETRVLPAAPAPPRTPERRRRGYVAWLLALGVVLVAGGGGAYLLLPGREEPTLPPTPGLAPVITPPVPALDERTRAQVDQLLTIAKADQEVDRLTDPPGSNAADLYRRVLELDPSNAEAKTGLQSIADIYAARARESLKNNERLDTTLGLVETGLGVMPEHAALRALQQQIKQDMAKTDRTRE